MSLAFALSLGLSLFLANSVVNDGAAGFNLGVTGRCEEVGRVPIGACSGRLGPLGCSRTSSGGDCIDRLLVDPYVIEGRLEFVRDHVCEADQSGPSGLPRRFDLSSAPQPKGWLSVEGRGRRSKEYTEEGREDDASPDKFVPAVTSPESLRGPNWS